MPLLTKLQRQPEVSGTGTRNCSAWRASVPSSWRTPRRNTGNTCAATRRAGAAERVAFRLRILRAAGAKARTGRSAGDEAGGWRLSGGFSQTVLGGSRESSVRCRPAPVPPAPQINENALFTDLDLARRRGESYDWVGRLSASYDKTFGQDTMDGGPDY